MQREELVKACEQTVEWTRGALAWVENPKNDVRVGQERRVLDRTLRTHAYRTRRLASSAATPMSVGVFGPSQAGKSYLVTILARKGETLTALFDDASRPEVNFIADINPYGDKEATGLVTRFTIKKKTTPPGFPVYLKLLTQTDLIKILANSYFTDADQQEEKQLSLENIEAHIAAFEDRVIDARQSAPPRYADILREEDIWDLEDYFQSYLRRSSEARIFASFWERFARTAPYLSLGDRAQLFSIFWGKHQELTDLFLTLSESLAKLGFSEEAFCSLDALLPSATGILNVETLLGLGDSGQPTIRVASASGHGAELPRPVVTALAAELCITMKEAPWPFFQETDLLDFPGYRSRTLYDFTKFLKEAKGKALKELFLRGKVDYLFQRYTADQELTSMLLCLRDSNNEVTTLAPVIENWIGATHGATPEKRRGKPVLLFFCLTMFDKHLGLKGPETGRDESAEMPTFALRFEARMKASLLDPFAKLPDSWPLAWVPGQPFKNCYWIRNPNIPAEGIIKYEGRNEVAILEDKKDRIAKLRAAYSGVKEVHAHFADPLRAFDEVMKLNDGGVSYLAANLSEVCRPGMKLEQIRARLKDTREALATLLAPKYVSGDLDKRLAERELAARQVVREFQTCVQKTLFGTFLRALCVERGALADALHEPSQSVQALNTPIEDKDFLDTIIEKGGIPSTTAPVMSRVDKIARTAMEVWTQQLHKVSNDAAFSSRIGVSAGALRELVNELVATARRLGVEREVRDTLDKVSHLERPHEIWAKATIVAERVINRFVTGLGSASSERVAAFDSAGIERLQTTFQKEFAVTWLRAFFEHVKANAQTADGLVHDAEQNHILGELLGSLGAG